MGSLIQRRVTIAGTSGVHEEVVLFNSVGMTELVNEKAASKIGEGMVATRWLSELNPRFSIKRLVYSGQYSASAAITRSTVVRRSVQVLKLRTRQDLPFSESHRP